MGYNRLLQSVQVALENRTQFTINNTTGRPKIRAIEADGAISFRSTEKAQ